MNTQALEVCFETFSGIEEFLLNYWADGSEMYATQLETAPNSAQPTTYDKAAQAQPKP